MRWGSTMNYSIQFEVSFYKLKEFSEKNTQEKEI